MNSHTRKCDKCSAMILHDPLRQPRDFRFTIEEGNGIFRDESRVVCRACEVDILNYIDGGGGNEDKVDLPYRVRSGIILENIAEELENMADKLDS